MPLRILHRCGTPCSMTESLLARLACSILNTNNQYAVSKHCRLCPSSEFEFSGKCKSPDTDRLTVPISFLVCYDPEFEKVLELGKGVRAEGGLRIRPTRTFATIRHRLTPRALESCHHLGAVLRRD
jgi:hypothetical protein